MPISVTATALSGEALRLEAVHEVAQFDLFFQEKLHNTALTPAERAILMTYLHYAVHQHGPKKEP